MIVLRVQIFSLMFSFGYGILFWILLELGSKILYHSKFLVKLIGSFLFVVVNVAIYFGGLMWINYGVLHLYFFLCILLGYCIANFVYCKFIVKK